MKLIQMEMGETISKGTIIEIRNTRGHGHLKEGDRLEILKDYTYSKECDRIDVRSVNDGDTGWHCDLDDFYVVKAQNLRKGDFVVVQSSGGGCAPEDVGKIFKIKDVGDHVAKKAKFATYILELDRKKQGNNDAYCRYACLRPATTSEIVRWVLEHGKAKEKESIPSVKLVDRHNDPYATIINPNYLPVGTHVIKGPDWGWGPQADNSVYGIVYKCTESGRDDSWDLNCHVNWIDEDGKVVGTNAYAFHEDHYDIMPVKYPVEEETTETEIQEQKPKEQKMSDTSMTKTSGFQVMIPEEAIQERVDKLVMYKLRHEKIHGILTDVVGKERVEITKNLKKEIYAQVKDDFESKKEKIVDAFLESKRTAIYLENKLQAVVDNPAAHKELPTLLKFLQLFKQAMIVGPTGSGKSTLAKQAAEAMKLRYGSFSCNTEASKSELVGFANLNGYITSQFLDFYENGGLFLVDEYDAMSPSIAVVLNAVFDRTGQISVPNRQENPVAKKHKDFYCILAGNTWGSGSVEYQGREMQDMAFLDRFKMCRIFVDYDETIEKTIAGDHYPWFKKIREFMDKHVEAEKFSTRSIYDASLLLFNNFSKQEILNMVTSHWDEELAKKIKTTVGV